MVTVLATLVSSDGKCSKPTLTIISGDDDDGQHGFHMPPRKLNISMGYPEC